ncbi:ribosomal protein S19 [Candidatus Carsonella ruddii HT isolate Thao2000]|uniref:Small ribosomal subunit protein uS19 n=1 Tax=Candidatus Carsonella ruddii HT isolate Thao2000 TaxID=1202539 RepID=J3Z1Q7_CARRU|nr:30S ribosomal protein S19 [Candidatus Carsonella ruddii]AFP84199.1 ribosomal protein S19 [Candidatus Carsonella ruddii HT isolate Thao2000]
MSRSIKKGFFIHKSVYKNFFKKNFKTWSRNSTIIPDMIDKSISVYNGKKFIKIYINEDMIGHKLGEFSITRNFKTHTKKNKKKNAK